LRARALAGDAGGWRCGLGVLQHRGVVAWLHAWHPVAVIPAGPPARGAAGHPVARNQPRPALVTLAATSTKATLAAATTSTDSPPTWAHNEMTLPP